MRTLKIEFTRSTKKFAPFSWLIRAVQKVPYSHVRLRWTNTTGIDLIYHASGTQVHFLGPLAQEGKQEEVVKSYEYLIDKRQYRTLINTCMTYAGVKYSWKQVINIGLKTLGFKKLAFKDDNEYAQVCSELVTRVMEQVLHKNLELDPDTAGPKEIDEALQREFSGSKEIE